MNFVLSYLNKISQRYSVVLLHWFKDSLKQIWSDLRQQPFKTIVVMAIITIPFVLLNNKLNALLLASIIPIIAYNWDVRAYFVIALIFLASLPIFLILKQEYWAEQMAIYVYYLLCLGVIAQIVEYVRESRQQDKSVRLELNKWVKLNISGLTLIGVIILFSLGFYYLNYKFTKQLTAQQDLLMRLGGYEIKKEDKEWTKIKSQLKDLIDLYSWAQYPGQDSGLLVKTTGANSVTSVLSIANTSVEFLNGTNISGIARILADQLKARGFTVFNVGNASGDYITTTIFYTADNKDKARTVQKEVNNYYITQLEESLSKLNSDVLVIVGSKKK